MLAGEVYEERSRDSTGGDGGRVRCGQSYHTPQQHQGLRQETQRLVGHTHTHTMLPKEPQLLEVEKDSNKQSVKGQKTGFPQGPTRSHRVPDTKNPKGCLS